MLGGNLMDADWFLVGVSWILNGCLMVLVDVGWIFNGCLMVFSGC